MSEKHDGSAPDSGADQEAHGDTGSAPDKSAQQPPRTVPYDRFHQVVQQRKDAESALEEVAKELAEEVPEDMRDVIPELPPAQRIKWIRAAMKKGVFGQVQQPNGPDSKRPGGKPPTDFDGMSPQAIMAQGYGQK